MAINKYKLINENKNVGVWIDTQDIINIAKICHKRNNYYYKMFVKIYEDLEDTKFNINLIKKNG